MADNPFAKYAETSAPSDNPFAKYATAAKPPAEPKTQSLLGSALQPFANVPKDISEEFRAGMATVRRGMEENKEALQKGEKPSLGVEAEPFIGAFQTLASPVTGTAKAIVGDPARAVIPQDSFAGRVAANTLEDLAGIVGPGPALKAAGIAGKAALEVPGAAIRGAKAIPSAAGEALGSLAAGTPREGMLDLHRAGWKIPPAQAVENPGAASDLLSGLQGKVKINQAYSEANFKIATEKAKADLGLGEEDSLSHESLENYRERVGRPAYNAVREIIPPMPVGNKFANFTFADKYVKDGSLSPSDAVQWVKELRFDAKANLKGAADPEKLRLGMTQKAQADAIEKQIEAGINSAPQLLASNIKTLRAEQTGLIKDITQKSNALAAELKKPKGMHYTFSEAAGHDAALERLGADIAEGRNRLSELSTELEENLAKAARANDLRTRSSIMQAYRDARTKIAKSYDIEDATTASGEIIPHRLAAMAAHGRPLSGGLKDIATAAERMPKAMQRPAQFGGSENISRLDLGYAVHEAAKGNVVPALGALTRKLSRGVTSSEAYQRGMFGAKPEDVLEDLKGQMK